MSSSSYLGHGAKYWADRYFELQTQTRLPDDSSSIDWKSKYLSLEKNCSLYQATIADLRTEIADLCEKTLSESKLFRGHTAEYWFNEYIAIDKQSKEKNSDDSLADECQKILSDNNAFLKKLEKDCDDKTAQLAATESKIKEIQHNLTSANEKLEIHLQNRIKSNAKSILFFSIFVVISFFLGRFSMDLSTALYIEPIPCAIFFVAGCCLSYVLCSSKYADARKAQKDSYDKSINDQKETFIKDLSAIVDGLDLLSLSNAPEASYLDQKGLPHIVVDGEDICTILFTPTGGVFHCQKNPCIKYLQTTNIAYLMPCSSCSRCHPKVPDLSWYGRCLSNAVILQRYGIDIHIPISSDEAIHRPQISSQRTVSAGTTGVSLKKKTLDSLIASQIMRSSNFLHKNNTTCGVGKLKGSCASLHKSPNSRY